MPAPTSLSPTTHSDSAVLSRTLEDLVATTEFSGLQLAELFYSVGAKVRHQVPQALKPLRGRLDDAIARIGELKEKLHETEPNAALEDPVNAERSRQASVRGASSIVPLLLRCSEGAVLTIPSTTLHDYVANRPIEVTDQRLLIASLGKGFALDRVEQLAHPHFAGAIIRPDDCGDSPDGNDPLGTSQPAVRLHFPNAWLRHVEAQEFISSSESKVLGLGDEQSFEVLQSRAIDKALFHCVIRRVTGLELSLGCTLACPDAIAIHLDIRQTRNGDRLCDIFLLVNQ